MARRPRRERGLVENASDPKQVRSAAEQEQLRLLQQQADLREVTSTRGGRRFLWRLLAESGIYRTTWVEGKADTTAFNEGLRARGLQILAEWETADAASYALAMSEHAADVAADQAVREAQAIDRERADEDAAEE